MKWYIIGRAKAAHLVERVTPGNVYVFVCGRRAHAWKVREDRHARCKPCEVCDRR